MQISEFHALPVEDVLRQFSTNDIGLTTEEAGARIEKYGPNEIRRYQPDSAVKLLAKQFKNFFILILLFAASLAFIISYLPGESNRRLTAFFILGIIAISVGLSFFEEYRAQKELEALGKLLVFKSLVLRDGARQQIDAAQIVPGDILILSRGQKVPADARVIQGNNLRADESALTGESLGVDKSPLPVPEDSPLAERASMVYGSTYITQGSGLAVAVRTGMDTEVGRIAETLQKMEERPTPFQVEVQKMARQMTIIVGSLAILIALILLFVLHESPLDVALNTLSLAVATIPESLPIVLTFALALGARQMAARHAVVRRLAVVESLGSVDTICTDKTGTLTQNKMALQRMYASEGEVALSGGLPEASSYQEILRAGVLCNDASVAKNSAERFIGDPVDTALLAAAENAGIDIESERGQYPKVDELAFDSERKMMTTLHKHDGSLIAYTKGAPGVVLEKSAFHWNGKSALPLDDAGCQSIQGAIQKFQNEGMYTLALARKVVSSPHAGPGFEQQLTFLGLLAFMDPPRPEAAGAIATAQAGGIRVVMITGDNALTARAIAGGMGIGSRAVDAREVDRLTEAQLREQVKEIDIVARATPQTKQQVLQALQEAGHFVAMTGDGVNDATALKQSDVGVAMGLRGTDIAKESAAMVLLDDNFATIVAAIEEGRRIFDNIRKFTNYLLSTSLGEVFIVLALSALGYFPLSAKMLLWVNVVTDLVPASALAADPAVPHVMSRRPRRHDEPILNRAMYATIAGSVIRTLIAYGLIFWAGLKLGGVDYARTMLFTSIVLHAFTRVMVVRQLDSLSIWSNPALLISYLAAVGLQLLALYTPLRSIFGIVYLDWRAWAVMIPVVAGSSLAGIYMTRWILKLIPLWEN